MKFLKSIPFLFIFLIVFPSTNLVFADGEDPNTYKALTSSNKNLSITNIKAFITEGDAFVENGEFDEAKSSYDKARNLAKKLSGFYSDLNIAFRGLDARIPNELSIKGKKTIMIWAETNSRLVALYKRKNQPEVAVPLLVEIIRLMSPTSLEGKEAYKDLIQLGFVETPYKGL